MCDCERYEPTICRKCWDSHVYCSCEVNKLTFELKEVRKLLKEEREKNALYQKIVQGEK